MKSPHLSCCKLHDVKSNDLKLWGINWGVNFLWLLYFRLLLSWPPAGRAIGRREGVVSKRLANAALPPRPARHTLSSYLLLHTPHCAAPSSARGGKRRRLVCFRTKPALPRPDHFLALMSSSESKPHDQDLPVYPGRLSSISEPAESRWLRKYQRPSAASHSRICPVSWRHLFNSKT